VTTTSATISWDGITVPETFDGDWNLYMADGDSVHTTVTPDAMMHTLLQAMGADFNDIDTTISVANSLIPVTIEPAGGNQMNISGSFQMEMIGVDEPVTFHFATTGTVGSTGMTIAPATINETVRAMNAINIDFTGSVTFVQPTALPVGGNLTIEIATINISGYGDTAVNLGFMTVTGTVTIGMTGSQLHASGTRDTAAQYPYYELVVTNTATGVETPVLNATTPYALENLTPSTAYTVKIRTHCDENTTSDWSDTVGFRTLDEPVVVDSCNAPTNLAVANVTAHSAAISWNGSAAQYEVELNGTVAATVNTNSYNAQGLDASTVYVVRVRALCDNSLTSEWSDTIGFRTLNEPVVVDSCDAPTNLAVANVTAHSAAISWNGNAAQYEVELNGTVAATVSANSYNAQGLDASTVYVVRVRALCDNSLTSDWSDTIGFRTLDEPVVVDSCDAPTNLAVSNVTAHTAAISWNGSAAQYEVELNGTVAATVNTNSYNAQGLDASTVYVVRVRALCDNSLTSEWSDTIGFRTLDEPIVNDSCDMPTNLAVSNVTANSATISWNGSAAQYEVELNGTVAATVSTNSYNAQGLNASTVYVVRVRALCDNSLTSDWSDTIGFRTLEGEGIDAIDANYSVNIYPNPASDRVTVNVEGLSGKAQVSVIDLSGRTLMSDTMTDGSVQLNVSSLAQGSYFVRISGERFTTVRKLIVK
jgi:hypothetical protein